MCPLTRNQTKALAFLTMFIDHIGWILFPSVLVFRIIGRLSFPLFAYLIGDGYCRTHDRKKFMIRLFLFGVISQPVFSLAATGSFGLSHINIFITLAAGVLFCTLMDIYREPENGHALKGLLSCIALIILIMAVYFIPMDYGIYGCLTVGFFYFWQKDECRMSGYVTFLVLNVLYFVLSGSVYQLFSLCAMFFLPPRPAEEKPWGKWAYAIYPVHLIMLYFIKIFSFAA